jgi:hypothetical protein
MHTWHKIHVNRCHKYLISSVTVQALASSTSLGSSRTKTEAANKYPAGITLQTYAEMRTPRWLGNCRSHTTWHTLDSNTNIHFSTGQSVIARAPSQLGAASPLT